MTGTLIGVGVLAVFATTAWFAGPAYLQAQSTTPEAVHAAVDRHQTIIESIATLIGSCAEVIAIHPRGYSPYAEVVLRLYAEDAEAVQVSELAVISHSRVLQSVTLYTFAGVDADDDPAGITTDRESIIQPGFCDLWRGNPDVTGRVLATGISDMSLTRVPGSEKPPGSRSLVRVELIWSADSTDGMDEAAVLVDAVVYQPSANVADSSAKE